MPASDPPAPTGGAAATPTSRFRDLHTRTYEVELLVSVALVFGLLRVPGAIEEAFHRWQPRLDGLVAAAATYLFLYAEMLAYSLLGTFLLHLCVRGYWVALLGLESVWPGGWDWSRLKLGPHSRRYAERRVASLAATIDRADDRASVVFAAGALLVLIFLYSIGLVVAAVAAGAGLAAATGGRVPGVVGFFTLLGAVVALTVVVPLLDRRLGARLPPDGRAGRWLGRAVGVAMRLTPLRATGPLQFVFQSRFGERGVTAATSLAALALVALMVGGLLWRTGQLRIDGWKGFDDEASAVWFDPRYYRDSGAARDGLQPSIDGERIAGASLRLYLPYRPRRHNRLLEERCPQPAAPPAGDANPASAACVGGLYRVALDGEPLAGLRYDFTRDVPSGFVGVVAFVDVRALPPGRHELAIDGPGGEEGETETVRVPFYRE